MTIFRIVLFKGFVGYLIVTLLVYLAPMPPAFANPVLQNPVPNGGSNVASAGAATITTKANTETITQTTGNAVIDWSSFNIGGKETTKFVDPSSSSLTVNRVHDNDPSKILGTLTSNGNIVLINPNGVFFGKGSTVDVNGIVATTSDVSNANVMAGGKLHFTAGGNPNATVENQGSITAKDAGLVGLVAPNVINSGVISAKLGKVQLSSGDEFTLDFYGDKLMEIAVTDPNLTNQLVENSGNIEADGGQVKITAAAARGIINSMITVSGKIDAPAFQQKNGEILIYAEGSNAVKGNIAANKGTKTGASTVQVSGTLDASGKKAGQKGGNISILGDDIAIQSGSNIDASGATSGGNIKIGGDFHGGGPTPTASATVVQTNATINANALDNGNGGNVAVWSDTRTEFLGLITAKGGPSGGDGGFVETSGHQLLSLNDGNGHSGRVDASAPHGQAGTWLLDPADVQITNADSGGGSAPTYVPDGSQAESTIDVANINTALNNGTNVSVTTGGDGAAGAHGGQIEVSANITKSSGTDATLTLSAATDIIIDSSISISSTTGKLHTILDANTAGNGGAIMMNSGSSIVTNGGDIYLGGGALDGQGHPTGAAVGDAANPNGIYLNSSTLNAGGGAISLNGQGSATGNANCAGNGGNCGVELRVNSVIETTGNGGNISITGTGGNTSGDGDYGVSISQGGTISTTGTGAITINATGNGSGSFSHGFYDYDGHEISSVDGPINIAGYGSSKSVTGYNNWGGYLYAFNNVIQTTGNGNINMTFAGGTGWGGENYGVQISGFTVQAGGTGNVKITGTGGSSANSAGVLLNQGNPSLAFISAANGNITIEGIGTGGGIGIGTDNNIHSVIGGGSMAGTITLIADTVSLANPFETTGNVTFKPYTSGTTVGIGSGTGTLEVTDGILSNIIAGSLTIGDGVNTAAMDINTAHTFASPTTFTTSGAAITLDSNVASSVSSGNALTFSNAVLNNAANTVSSGNGNITFANTINGANALTVNAGTGTTTFTGAVGGGTPLTSLTVAGSGGITVDSNITTNNGNINLNGPVTLGGNSVINAGSGTITTGSTIDGNFNLNAAAGSLSLGGAIGGGTPLNNVALTSTNAVTLPAINAASVNVQATGASGDITLGGNIATSGGGNDIVLAANRNFINSGNYTLTPTGRWIIYSTQASSDNKGGLSEVQDIYSQTYGSEAPGSVPNPGQKTWIYSSTPPLTPVNITLTATNQTVGYATAGDAMAGVTVTYTCTAGACADVASLSGGTITVSGSLNSTNSYYTANSAHTITLTPGSITVNWNPGYSTGVITYGTGTLTVNQATLTVTAAATGTTSKVYDGTTTAAGVNLSGNQLIGDVVNITDTTVTFSDKNVGNGKTVTAAGLSISGADAANYSLGNNTATTTANITPEAITVTAQANTKTFDNTNSANASPTVTAGTIMPGDTANFAETYNTSAVGTGKTLTPSGTVTDGNGGNNYTYTFANNLTGEIDAVATNGSGNGGKVVLPTPGATPSASNDSHLSSSGGDHSSSISANGQSGGTVIINVFDSIESQLQRVIPNPLAATEPVKLDSPDPTDYVISLYDLYKLSRTVTKLSKRSKREASDHVYYNGEDPVTMTFDPANDNESDVGVIVPSNANKAVPAAWSERADAARTKANTYQIADNSKAWSMASEEETTAIAEYDSANDNPDNVAETTGKDNNPADNGKDRKKVRQNRSRERLQQRLARGLRPMRGGQQFGRIVSRLENA